MEESGCGENPPSSKALWRTRDACGVGGRTANGCLFNYVSSSLFIATNAPHPFLFSFLRYDAGGWRYYADAVAGKLVQFYLPDVLQELREKAKTSKRNVARRV